MKITGVVTILSHSCRPICRKWRDFCVLLRSKKRVGDKTTCQFTSVAFVYSELQISTIPWIFYRTFDPCEEFILSFFLFFEIFQKKKEKNIPNFTSSLQISLRKNFASLARFFYLSLHLCREYLLSLTNLSPYRVRNNR